MPRFLPSCILPPAPCILTDVFVTFEGPDGAGKSSALARVAEALRASRPVLATREPGAGAFGATIRELLLGDADPVPRAELFLFLADRAEHVAKTVRPALARGEVVLCDRHADSTLVYQGLARGLDENFLRRANAFATDGLTPDLTLLFDVDVETAQSRLQARLTSRDRLDAAGLDFHRKVRDGFLDLARAEPGRFRVLDASRGEAEVGRAAVEAVMLRLGL